MSSSKKDDERKVFDVHTSRKSVHGRNVLNLRPKFAIRHPLASVFVVLGIVVIVFVGVRQLSTRAAVQDFFPTTCLGNWQNVANAQGIPETLNSSDTPFSGTNSAMYASGTEIYCGGFVAPPSFATSGQITNVGLTLVWQIGDTPTSTPTPTSTLTSVPASASTTSPSSTDVSASSSDDDLSTSTASDTLAATTTTTITPSSTTSTPPAAAPSDASGTSFIRQLIPFAFADDAASGTNIIPGTTTVAAVTTTTISSTTTMASDTNATATVVMPAPIPDENFLDVSYSTDGQTWISIGQVSLSNWQQFTVTLPISDWADLQNLQIRVEGIPTTQDPIPPIYLDGMFVEVDYSVPSPILGPASPSAASSSVSQVIQVSPNVTITEPPAQQPTSTVPAPTITAITKSASQVSVTVQYVGQFYGGNPLYLFVYPDGTAASRNDADSAFTFAGTPTEGPSVNAREIDGSAFDPTTDQTMITIVAPAVPDDSEIATADMATGTYDVDISYFDGQLWHLIPAQTFTWP